MEETGDSFTRVRVVVVVVPVPIVLVREQIHAAKVKFINKN